MGMKPFIILGLPRSMTAWTSCFLTCGELFCLHEVFRLGVSGNEIAATIKKLPYLHAGIACPGSLMVWREIVSALPDATLVYIRRPTAESRAALSRVSGITEGVLENGYRVLERHAQDFIQQAEPYVMDVGDLKDEFGARVLWQWVAPDVPIPELHLRRMMSLHIEQHPKLIEESAQAAYEKVLAQ